MTANEEFHTINPILQHHSSKYQHSIPHICFLVDQFNFYNDFNIYSNYV
jgi:hypothetical protein